MQNSLVWALCAGYYWDKGDTYSFQMFCLWNGRLGKYTRNAIHQLGTPFRLPRSSEELEDKDAAGAERRRAGVNLLETGEDVNPVSALQ